jgi:protein-tyrosine phosphatase
MRASKITPRLSIGAAVDPANSYDRFDVIVLCAASYQPGLPRFAGEIIRAPFADSARLGSEQRRLMFMAAHKVARHLRRGHRVLVTCRSGLNRSALVAGLALKITTGWPIERIIARIHKARGQRALSNSTFVGILHAVATGDLR